MQRSTEALGNQNHFKKHYGISDGRFTIDPCSSARWFSGWAAQRKGDDGPRPTEEAKTFLLKTAWRKHGLLSPSEAPKAAG